MNVDAVTLEQFEYQARRMHQALHGNPKRVDRKEAELIQRRVDDILDRRPVIHSIATDGEVIFDDQSPWVMAQAVNTTGQAERVLTREQEAQVARWGHVLSSLPDVEDQK